MGTDIKLSNILNPDWWEKDRKIGRHSRKLNGETFVSPRIVLPSGYNRFIGKTFRLYEADVEVTESYWGSGKVIRGTALILVIPESVERLEDDMDDFDDIEE